MKIYIGMEQVKFRNCLNRLLHEIQGCAPAIILTIFFCKVKIIVRRVTPENYSIYYNGMEVCIVNCFETDSG